MVVGLLPRPVGLGVRTALLLSPSYSPFFPDALTSAHRSFKRFAIAPPGGDVFADYALIPSRTELQAQYRTTAVMAAQRARRFATEMTVMDMVNAVTPRETTAISRSPRSRKEAPR